MKTNLFLSILTLLSFSFIKCQSLEWSFQYESTYSYASVVALDNEENILPQHVAEAIQYRSLDRENWGS